MANEITTNLTMDLGAIVGAGPKAREATKKALRKIDTTLAPLTFISDATNSTDVVTKFNALKADLIAKGRMAAS